MKFRLLFLILIFGTICTAQNVETFKPAILKTKKGAKVVFNSPEHAFTFDLVSDSIKPPEKPNFLIIDNHVFQYVVLTPSNRVNYDSLSIERKKVNLTSYMNYELDYFKKDLKLEIENLKTEWVDLNGRLFLFWFFDMPESNKSVEKQIYLTTICFDNIVGFNTPVTRDKNEISQYKNLLFSAANTLKTFSNPINLDELYNELNK
jgi:hypothetical protein